MMNRDNGHYFTFNSHPTVLIGASGGYGQLMNLDVDYIDQLDRYHNSGLNAARVFGGTFLITSSNNIQDTLHVSDGRFICPYARSSTPGYCTGGNKFDLDTWDACYFDRLHDFMFQAAQRNIVVEYVLFSQFYSDEIWACNPMNAVNNIQEIGNVDWIHYCTRSDAALFSRQKDLVRKVVTELNDYNNLYFEVCNEPPVQQECNADLVDWCKSIAQTVADAEAQLAKKHIIGFQDPSIMADRNITVHNAHYTFGPSWVGSRKLLDDYYDLNQPLAFNETCVSTEQETPEEARVEAWEFMIGGGAVINNLSFQWNEVGGKMVRSYLGALKDFMNSFDFIKMTADKSFIASGIPYDAKCRALKEDGRQYAVYIHHGTGDDDMKYTITDGSHNVDLTLLLPAGYYKAEWIYPGNNNVLAVENFCGGSHHTLTSPAYSCDIALRIFDRSAF